MTPGRPKPPERQGRAFRRPRAAVVLALSGLLLQACASSRDRCGLAACGEDDAALLKITAEQLSVAPETVTLYDIRHYPGATVAWRVRQGGRLFQCREARDAADPSQVHFVYCRPAT